MSWLLLGLSRWLSSNVIFFHGVLCCREKFCIQTCLIQLMCSASHLFLVKLSLALLLGAHCMPWSTLLQLSCWCKKRCYLLSQDRCCFMFCKSCFVKCCFILFYILCCVKHVLLLCYYVIFQHIVDMLSYTWCKARHKCFC